MKAVAEKIIRSFVDMAKDLRFGLEAHDRGARQMTIHFLSELCHEGQSSWKVFRYGGEAALLVFVDLQIGPVGGGAEENSVCIPLDPDFILAACIDQPCILPQANFFQQRSDIDTGTDELKVFHEAFPFPVVTNPVCIIFFVSGFPKGTTGVAHAQRPPRRLLRSSAVTWTAGHSETAPAGIRHKPNDETRCQTPVTRAAVRPTAWLVSSHQVADVRAQTATRSMLRFPRIDAGCCGRCRSSRDGSVMRMKDVARIGLGTQTYNVIGRLNDAPAAIINVFQLPGYNAVAAVDGVQPDRELSISQMT